MSIKVAVAGSNGRMGKMIVEILALDPEIELVAKISRATETENLNAALDAKVTVCIDFTPPEAVLNHLSFCLKHKINMVIGTTGFSDVQKAAIAEASKNISIVFAPNMSVGVNLTFKLLELAARVLQESADIAILDIHHKHKQDAPSGTALKMSDIIKSQQKKETKIDIASLRVGEVMGEHSILFALPEEEIKITHQAFNRKAFAEGAVKAAKWVNYQKPGLYDMQDVLGLN
jgi:4-hydroxy-tetrahydrodipicolinate reductase